MSEYETREFTAQELDAMGIAAGDARFVVMDEITDHGRWHLVHTVVFLLDGKFYEVDYSEPATEHQETDRWGYGGTVLAKVVRPVTVSAVQFVPVKVRG